MNLRLGLGLVLLLAACSSRPPPSSGFGFEEGSQPMPPLEDPPHAFPPPVPDIDRDRELLVTDAAVLAGARSDNADPAAPWSFRHVMEALAAEGAADATTFVRNWLGTWQTTATAPGIYDSGLPLDARPSVEKELVCPWLRLTPENACDETCGSCAGAKLDLAVAPFKLLAIVNRLDLGETTSGCSPQSSEARFVFAALRPGTSIPLALNVIIEYRVTGTSAGEPSAWHALGALRGEDYAMALERVTRSFTDDLPLLAQVRTSENLAGTGWQLRQFTFPGGKLQPTALTNTVADAFNGTAQLSAHLQSHQGEIFNGDNAVPIALATATSSMPRADFRWTTSPDVDPQTRHLFALSTCNGCHAGEREDTSVLPFAHIGMDTSGATIVSRFLSNPEARDTDELSFRARSLQRRLTGGCGSPEAAYGNRNGGGGGGPVSAPTANGSAPRVH